jgi:ABC-type nitrate/sulfonate/bicarbonate transport system substrate-binding protein
VIARDPDAVAAAVRALVKTQQALKADVSLATKVGRKLFPASEAELIADLVERDLPFYDPAISREFVAGMTEFQRQMGLLNADVSYDDIVATRFSQYWKA